MTTTLPASGADSLVGEQHPAVPAAQAASRTTSAHGPVTLPVPTARSQPLLPGEVPERLTDRYGRTVRDLRLSVTDRCNLRCTYCMPASGLEWLPSPLLLTTEEIARLARLAVERLGVERIRLTGGEPLMRRDLEAIVGALSRLRSSAGTRPDIALTTNGLGLDKRAGALRQAGLDRVNISIDTLDPHAYAELTRRDRLEDVLAGARAAQAAGLSPLKVNAVALPATVKEQAPWLLRECLRQGWQLRLIEHMPLGPRDSWRAEDVVGVREILGCLREAGFELTEQGRPGGRPAALWHVAAGADHPAGDVGIIASVTAPFCEDCDRTRVTADGRVMPCLFSPLETDLRGPLRAGADDDELIRVWAGAMWLKPRAHGSDAAVAGPTRGARADTSRAGQDNGFARPLRTMSAIGG